MKINRHPLRLTLALTAASAIVLGAGVSGASASNGAEKSSEKSHEAHEENGHPNPEAVQGHDEDDNPGRGVGHEDHGNGHGYGHGDVTHQSEPSDDGHDASMDDDGESGVTGSTDTGSTGTGTGSSGSGSAGGNEPGSVAGDTSVSIEDRGTQGQDRGLANTAANQSVAVADDRREEGVDAAATSNPQTMTTLVAVVADGKVVRLVDGVAFGGGILRAS